MYMILQCISLSLPSPQYLQGQLIYRKGEGKESRQVSVIGRELQRVYRILRERNWLNNIFNSYFCLDYLFIDPKQLLIAFNCLGDNSGSCHHGNLSLVFLTRQKSLSKHNVKAFSSLLQDVCLTPDDIDFFSFTGKAGLDFFFILVLVFFALPRYLYT